MKDQDLSGEWGELPNIHYKKFFDKFKEIETLKVEDWKPVHVLSYFCKKYEERYLTKFEFKFNDSSPSKCFEMYHMKKLGINLSSDPQLLKQYVDWVYETKVNDSKRKLTSIAFLSHENLVNDFKLKFLNKKLNTTNIIKINRTDLLPDYLIKLFEQSKIPMKTYGDLSFYYQAVQDTVNDKNQLDQILQEAEKSGFSIKILKDIV